MPSLVKELERLILTLAVSRNTTTPTINYYGVAMNEERLLPVAAIAREIDVPESTVHYWKNKFQDYLPASGRGRQKRFKPAAINVFRTIRELLDNGYTTPDIRHELEKRFASDGAGEIDFDAGSPEPALDDRRRTAASARLNPSRPSRPSW